MKSKILSELRAQDGYVSGQQLCEAFGVTRTAIWKGIRQLREEGYQIEAVPNKGYRLISSPDSISAAEIKSRLETAWAGRELIYLDTVDSTNNYAKKLAQEGAAHGTLVVSDFQEGGKGRRGRGWMTPHSTAIAMSLLIRPELRPEKASMLTLVMGVAAARGVREVTGLDVQIKWPNDLVIGGKKICGILTELGAEMERIHYLVIGVGINANLTEFPEELRETATSLRLELGRPVDRGAVICACMKAFEEYYDKFLRQGDLSLLMDDYQRLLANCDREVRVLDPSGEYKGIARGIDRLGQLLVEKEDGTVTAVYAGEVSVRGIYQYV